MIQRIQSVYLVLGAASLVALLFFDVVWAGGAADAFAWYAPTLAVLGAVLAAAAVVAVFLYKDRQRQRRVVVGLQALTVLFLLIFYGGQFLADELTVTTEGGLDQGRLIAWFLPVLAYIFFFLARRGIDRDIALVRSMDRLR